MDNVITVKNTSDRPQPITTPEGKTITIYPKATTQIDADFATSLPRAVRILSV
jgi:hypothetical protein